MAVIRVEHPLIEDVLTTLRDAATPREDFRRLTRKLSSLLVFEASRNLPLRQVDVETPLERTTGGRLNAEIVLVPVLRAGMGMLDSLLELFPGASVGYVGLERDEETAVARRYYLKLPDLADRHVFLLDPMLATGGSALAAIQALKEQGARSIRLLCIVAAPEGVALLEKHCPDVSIFAAAIDRQLDERKYILPGLGDFGDRLFGT
ncbi:MAG TPA: uracil phosphoribosyltransferase [Vicinamibacteria bacterium]|jgi:uracil phosphoribosyltransferase